MYIPRVFTKSAYNLFQMSKSTKAKSAATKLFSREEVAKNNDPERSFWIVINGDVLDLTHFVFQHPGGLDVLLKFGGGKRNAGAVFESIHSSDTKEMAKDFIIGKLAQPSGNKQQQVHESSKSSSGGKVKGV